MVLGLYAIIASVSSADLLKLLLTSSVNFLIYSLKNLAGITVSPSIFTSALIVYSIANSKSVAVNINLSSSTYAYVFLSVATIFPSSSLRKLFS